MYFHFNFMLEAILGSALTCPLCIIGILCSWALLRVIVLGLPHIRRIALPH
jgi:hypothetical protein